MAIDMSPAFIKGVTLGEVILGAAGLAVLVVILRLTRAVGRLAHQLARKSAESAAAPAKSSGSGSAQLVSIPPDTRGIRCGRD